MSANNYFPFIIFMFADLLPIFINVISPVFIIVLLSFTLGPRLDLNYRSLSRTAYYILIPAFIFNVFSQIQIDLETMGRMAAGITLVYFLTGAAGWGVARLLGYGKEMAIAFLMTCVLGNVGNFGLALTSFRLGEGAIQSATVYMQAVSVFCFTTCVLAAGWMRGGSSGALKNLFKTPAIIALPIALVFPFTGMVPPTMLLRISGLLGDAMIPIMLLVLGIQLREAKRLEFSIPTFTAAGIRLIFGPLAAFFLIPFAGLTGIEAQAGILQASMPPAIMTVIIALENNIAPTFVTSVVFLGTLFSLVSLTIVMTLI